MVLLCGLAACAQSADGKQLNLPAWLAHTADRAAGLDLEQKVELDGTQVRVCRVMHNRRSQDLLISRVHPQSSGGGISTIFLDPDGTPVVRDMSRMHSESFVPPPIPSGPGDLSPYSEIKAGASLTHCSSFDPAPGRDRFRVISFYQSPLPRANVQPEIFEARPVIVTETGAFLSNICTVDWKRRQVSCERLHAS